MTARKREIIRWFTIAGIGFLIGSLFVIIVLGGTGSSWSIFKIPFMFALYVVGVVYGFPQFIGLLGRSARAAGAGLVHTIFGASMKLGGCLFFIGLARLIAGLLFVGFVLSFGWLPGLYFSYRAISEASSELSSTQPSMNDDWSDESFRSELPPARHNFHNDWDEWI